MRPVLGQLTTGCRGAGCSVFLVSLDHLFDVGGGWFIPVLDLACFQVDVQDQVVAVVGDCRIDHAQVRPAPFDAAACRLAKTLKGHHL